MLRNKLAVVAVAIGSLAADAQTVPIEVGKALQVYSTCVIGTIQGSVHSGLPVAQTEVVKYVQQLDKNCLGWTVIWYPALSANAYKLWPKNHRSVFTQLRLTYMSDVIQLLLANPDRPK